jgi:hypothetical protein
LLGGAGAGAAPAAVTVGEVPSALDVTCLGSTTIVQGTSRPGAPSFTVPFAGVITSFSVRANTDTNKQVRMVVVGPPAGSVYPIHAKTAPKTLLSSSVNTFDVRVPVRAGWLLGANFVSTACGQTGSGADKLILLSGDLDTDETMSGTSLGAYRVNISAELEPDVDSDGYGDVTQDACPESALAVVPCPAPGTRITKAPKAKSKKRDVTVRFAATAPRATFLVSVDGKRAVEMLSPLRIKLKPGKHRITVSAVSPLGIVDPTPATTRFKIKKS